MYSDKKKYIRKMDEKAEKYHNQRIMKNVLKSWLDIMMDNNKIKIKNDVLQKTEIQVSRIQTEYEKLIRTLEETLEKKLTELKKEEQEHKMLHDKYEAMYSRARVEGSVR